MDDEVKVEAVEEKKETRGRKPKIQPSEAVYCQDCKLYGTHACLSCIDYKK